jgi:hypothetical protein
MIDINNNPFGEMHEGKKFQGQMTIVFEAFFEKPKTMKMVFIETGIDRSNITRFIAIWKNQGRICKVDTKECPVTKHPFVGFYTTDPAKCPKSNQLNLF